MGLEKDSGFQSFCRQQKTFGRRSVRWVSGPSRVQCCFWRVVLLKCCTICPGVPSTIAISHKACCSWYVMPHGAKPNLWPFCQFSTRLWSPEEMQLHSKDQWLTMLRTVISSLLIDSNAWDAIALCSKVQCCLFGSRYSTRVGGGNSSWALCSFPSLFGYCLFKFWGALG